MQPGDYLFVMFAINDSADDSSNRKTKPESTFKAYLRLYVDAARRHGATPVFVTSQTKRTFDVWGRFTNSVGAYPQAMRELGAELGVPVIDLNRKSIEFFTSVGPEATKRSFMYLAPGESPNYPNGSSDYIHFQETGARQLAKLVVEAVRELNIQPLAQHVLSEPGR
jgi:lysophospholipase L1-like esterase